MPDLASLDETTARASHTLRRAVEVGCGALEAGLEPEQLADHLYAAWYAVAVAPPEVARHPAPDLVQVLRTVHAGSEVWESGWTAELVGPSAELVARKGEERRELDRCDYTTSDRRGLAALPGAGLLTPARLDSLAASGWWCTHSPDWQLDAPKGELVRLYWNVGAEAVATLVSSLTLLLLDLTTWMLKCAVDREQYVRADAVVLYLPRQVLGEAHDRIREIHTDLVDVLRDGAPPLTLQAAPGLAVSDDPGTGESFGQHRSRLIAEGILRASPPTSSTDRHGSIMAGVAERFNEEGVPIERPHLSDRTRSLPWG